jgi:hypothetical protein
MAIGRRQVKSKALMFYVLQCYPETDKYLPPTEILGYKSLKSMLETHNEVYVKPDSGCKSKGIIRIQKLESTLYVLRRSDSEVNHEFKNFRNLWIAVKEMTSKTRHILQKGIKCVTNDMRNFDIRAHALRVRGEWVIGGICVRLGAPGNIVTTSHIGGTPIHLETLFSDLLGYSEEDQQKVLEKLHDCILNTVKKISPVYPSTKEFGVDMGIDHEKNVWLYEVNTAPLIAGNFKLLPDLTLYEKIVALKRMAR